MRTGSPRAAGSHAGECHSCVTNHRIVKESRDRTAIRRSFPGLARGRAVPIDGPSPAARRGRSIAFVAPRAIRDPSRGRDREDRPSRSIAFVRRDTAEERSVGLARPGPMGGPGTEAGADEMFASRRNPRGKPAYSFAEDRGWCRRGLVDANASQAGFPRKSLERR